MSDLRVIRGASNSRYGGIHWYEWRPKDEAAVGPPARDLFVLHPLPHDGSFFSVIAPYLAAGRTVVAPEYPGYGKSDTLREEPTIGRYADAMIDVLRARDTHGAADLFGYLTGCLVAVEMSLRYPNEVHRVVQVDVPFYGPAERRRKLRKDWAVGGFVAAFSYPCQERYPLVAHECLLIATGSDVLEPTRAAAEAIPGSVLNEFPDIHDEPLETGAPAISAATLEFLDP